MTLLLNASLMLVYVKYEQRALSAPHNAGKRVKYGCQILPRICRSQQLWVNSSSSAGLEPGRTRLQRLSLHKVLTSDRLDLTPLNMSSSGKERMGKISKKGGRFIRKLLVVSMTSRAVIIKRPPQKLDLCSAKIIADKSFRLTTTEIRKKSPRSSGRCSQRNRNTSSPQSIRASCPRNARRRSDDAELSQPRTMTVREYQRSLLRLINRLEPRLRNSSEPVATTLPHATGRTDNRSDNNSAKIASKFLQCRIHPKQSSTIQRRCCRRNPSSSHFLHVRNSYELKLTVCRRSEHSPRLSQLRLS